MASLSSTMALPPPVFDEGLLLSILASLPFCSGGLLMLKTFMINYWYFSTRVYKSRHVRHSNHEKSRNYARTLRTRLEGELDHLKQNTSTAAARGVRRGEAGVYIDARR